MFGKDKALIEWVSKSIGHASFSQADFSYMDTVLIEGPLKPKVEGDKNNAKVEEENKIEVISELVATVRALNARIQQLEAKKESKDIDIKQKKQKKEEPKEQEGKYDEESDDESDE